jgi:hypothetical protein
VKTSSIPILKGKLSVTSAGRWFAKLQMKKGVEHFRHCGDEDFDLGLEEEEVMENEYGDDESSSGEEESDTQEDANEDVSNLFDLSEILI